MSAAASLDDLLAKDAITDVLARYSRTLDWLDEAGQASCYWPDAPIDYGFFKGSAADFVPVVMAIERRSARRWHLSDPPAIRLTGAAHAEVETYGLTAGARLTETGSYAGTMYGGRYLDAFEKREGEWRISRRDYVLDWSHPIPDQPVFDPNAAFPLPILEVLQGGHAKYRAI
ncbi:nuclear transport factor 2 family protein [Novosphingobium sp. PASSN1]|uniref:nuclear transport factor 2 family protein n=1 Tax=Novosphingobium sp. PASSN1 TaxID=2015561 RepID=UPI0025F76766|nr:nuclear transport factor 2 family protein [Novosphingobium sp. PASSN1]